MGVGFLPAGRAILIKNCEERELLKSMVWWALVSRLTSVQIGKPRKARETRCGFSQFNHPQKVQTKPKPAHC